MADDPKLTAQGPQHTFSPRTEAVLPALMRRGVAGFRPRERRLALIATAVVGCWVVVSWVVQPLWDRVQALRLHLQTQSEQLKMFHRLLAQAPPTGEDPSQVASYAAPQNIEEERGAFFSELEALSRANALQLHLKPKPIQREAHLSRIELELDVEGSQQSLLAFLDALFGRLKLMTIERLRVSSVPTKEHALHANLVIQQLLLR